MKSSSSFKKSIPYIVVIGVLALLFISITNTTSLTSPTATNTAVTGQAFMQSYSMTPAAVLLDVRTPAEFNTGHIAGASNIDFENQSFASEIKKLDPTKTYFVYCRSGNRSGQAVTSMKTQGFSSLVDLKGGVAGNKSSITLVTGTSSSSYSVDPSDMIQAESFVVGAITSSVTEKEKLALIQMREEEKLARDVYTTLGAIYNVPTFANIARSEQTHTDAIKALLVKYNIPDPVTNNAVGVFSSKDMQKLYDTLVAQGKKSLTDALVVGATVEDLDIYDIDKFMKETTKTDILSVYANLQKGSRNHLRAFVSNIQSQGGTYTPVYITQDAYTAIITSPQERGRI